MTRAGRSVTSVPRAAGRLARRAAHAQGAGQSGLGRLIELSAVSSAGDALVAVALAGTMFFGLPVDEARGQVLLYLLVTMAPFALVAPLIGPLLDRMRTVRRFAIAGTMVLRAVLCWGMAGAVPHGDALTLLPMAFGALVLSKAYGVSRSAVTPRVLPPRITLVRANARASFAMLIAASLVAPAGAGLVPFIGADWVLRIGTVIFAAGAVLGVRLHGHVDEPGTAAHEGTPGTTIGAATGAATGRTDGGTGDPDGTSDEVGDVGDGDRRGDGGTAQPGGPGRGGWRLLPRVGPVVAEAMRANAALRLFSGFLVLYLAFLLRERHFGSVPANVALALLVGAAGAGGLAGTAAGAWIKAREPWFLISGTLTLATVTAAVCAALFGLWAALAVAFVGGFAQALGKLGMDATVQREISEGTRSSTFAASETLHQLAWVIGGMTGLGMSLVADGRVALAIVAVVLAVSLGTFSAHRHRRLRRGPAVSVTGTERDPEDGQDGRDRPDARDVRTRSRRNVRASTARQEGG